MPLVRDEVRRTHPPPHSCTVTLHERRKQVCQQKTELSLRAESPVKRDDSRLPAINRNVPNILSAYPPCRWAGRAAVRPADEGAAGRIAALRGCRGSIFSPIRAFNSPILRSESRARQSDANRQDAKHAKTRRALRVIHRLSAE